MLTIFTDHMVVIGLFLAMGLSISLALHRFNIPHIVVYLLVGFTLSNTLFSGINFFDEYEELFIVVETVALGLIGFKIGTELKNGEIWEDRRVLFILLVMEATGAFFIVFSLVFLWTGNFLMALLLGGVSTATAPAATIEVIRKLNARGSLTKRLHVILALDDVVAVVFIELIIVLIVITLGGAASVSGFFLGVFSELGVAIILGLVVGLLLDFVVERMHDDLEMLEFTLGILLLAMGIAHFMHTSVIFTTMIIGGAVTNIGGDNYAKAGDLLEVIMTPVVTLFFVLVGARVSFGDFSPFPILALIYLLGRTIGKIGGAFAGGKTAKLEPCVTNNLGFGLLAQGGVALGLISVLNEILIEHGETEMGNIILTTVIISTIFSEIVGSYGARFAIERAGEANPKEIPEHVHDEHCREIHPRE
ncbi:MAG: cation:proton antiporter [Candidatus Heimdallarchaeota archaeon]|nr:cation:proton antiporter [Candidatus Heimdallarchaeota archaeon]